MPRRSKNRMPSAPASEVAPFLCGEPAQDRHWRRLEIAVAMQEEARTALAELGLRLNIGADLQHWQVHDAQARVAEWWPQSGRFVVRGNYKRPQKFHDVPGFVLACRRLHVENPLQQPALRLDVPRGELVQTIAVEQRGHVLGWVRYERGEWLAFDLEQREVGRAKRKRAAVALVESTARSSAA